MDRRLVLEIIPVRAKSKSAQEKHWREVYGQHGIERKGQAHRAIASRKVTNDGCEQHVKHPATNLGAPIRPTDVG